MNAMLQAYEKRLRNGASQLEQMERTGRTDQQYDRMLRQWLQLLAAYEYEYEMAEAGGRMLAAAM
jgi:hypothetical protein